MSHASGLDIFNAESSDIVGMVRHRLELPSLVKDTPVGDSAWKVHPGSIRCLFSRVRRVTYPGERLELGSLDGRSSLSEW
jgi:hypothetical protein